MGEESLRKAYFAASYGNVEELNRLYVQDPQQLNELGHLGRTPLHGACIGGHPAALAYLLTHAAIDVNAQDANGLTAAHSAAFNGELECLKTLAERGADLSIRDHTGQHLVHKAATQNQTKILEYLFIRGIQLQQECNDKKSPLHYAAENGGMEALQLLIEQNVDVNGFDRLGRQPIHSCVIKNQLSCLKALLRNGISVRSKTSNGKEVIHLGAQFGSLKCFHWLLETQKGLIDARDESGDTAGHVAAFYGKGECFNCWLMHGGTLDIRGKDGKTIMDSARAKGHPVLVQKAVNNEVVCDACVVRLKKDEWERFHEPSKVEKSIQTNQHVVFSHAVDETNGHVHKERSSRTIGTTGTSTMGTNTTGTSTRTKGKDRATATTPPPNISLKFFGEYIHK